MTFLAWWLLLLILAGPVGWVASLIRRDHNRTRDLETENRRLTNLVAKVCEERDAKDQQLRDWAAHVDDLYATQERHAAVCPWAQAEPEIARWS